jgi:two-component system, NarL family, sensor histidine kinase BarA
MFRGLSLANKCLLLFGGAVVFIVLAALYVPWLRMNALVDAGQLEVSRQMAGTWDRRDAEARADRTFTAEPITYVGVSARLVSLSEAEAMSTDDPFVSRAIQAFTRDPIRLDMQHADFRGRTLEYRYARAVRTPPPAPSEGGKPGEPELRGLLMLERRPIEATRLLLLNTVYLLAAGAVVLALALVVFYQITHRLILSPVRDLKTTAERVREGDLAIRSSIRTGDEFEELASTFNHMLADLQASQDRLRGINTALDLKLNELAASNSVLADAAKMKGEFLASISHELRTPLNSVIGFAELLQEFAKADQARPGGTENPTVAKRLRYIENILTAARSLLDLINSILDMAKLEAGRVKIQVEKMNLRDAGEGLIALITPLADKKGISLKLEVAPDLPMIRTDAKKVHQIVFNFLSNAVKFTPAPEPGRQGLVTLRIERIVGTGDRPERVRISVLDTGIGIPADKREKIFEKFHQLDGGYTRGHAGTGLGLAISRELAALLHGEIQLESEDGRGSMFSVILPLSIESTDAAESELESRFRGTLSGRRAWTG